MRWYLLVGVERYLGKWGLEFVGILSGVYDCASIFLHWDSVSVT